MENINIYIYPLLTILYLWMFIWSYRTFRNSSYWGTSWLLFIMVALIYDNTIISLGHWIGPGQTLETLSLMRYLLKVFLTPTLVFIAWDILRRIQVEWSGYLSSRILFNVYTFLITILGVFTEILWITIRPIEQAGVVRYIQMNHPIPYFSVFIVIPLFIAGIYLWRQQRWPILLLGVSASIVLGFTTLLFHNDLFTSTAELIIVYSLVLSEWTLHHDDY